MRKICVLLTCFNRKATTLRCLQKLKEFDIPLDIYLVDDGSTDETTLSISKLFPEVIIITGPGNLFWNRGMHLAWKTASETKDYEYYIWLNDDVLLYNNCFEELFACSSIAGNNAIISGLVESHDGAKVIYGGYDINRNLIKSTGHLQTINNLNGNAVLVPRTVFKALGNLDPVYHHDLGDVDYGLRAKARNIQVYSTRTAIGSGDSNAPCRVRLWDSTLIPRFKKLYSPLGSPPGINFYFKLKHFGLLNSIKSYAFIHLINILPDKVIKSLFGNKYM